MLLLTIETSTPLETVALVERGRVLGERSTRAGRGRTEELLKAVRDVLESGSRPLSELDAVAVSIGPGRFTGLRVGLATARGLAAPVGLPIVPVPTLPALAATASASGPSEAAWVAPMLDARRGEVYAAVFRAGVPPRRATQDAAVSPERFVADVAGMADDGAVLFAGTGASLYRDAIVETLGELARFPETPVDAPGPSALAALAEASLRRGETDPSALRPVYLRGV